MLGLFLAFFVMAGQLSAQTYNPWQDYSRAQVGSFVPLIGGGYVPIWALPQTTRRGRGWYNPNSVATIPHYQQVQRSGRTMWQADENGTVRYYDSDPRANAQAKLIEAEADRKYAENERYRERTQNRFRKRRERRLKSGRHAGARDAVREDVDSGLPSVDADEWTGGRLDTTMVVALPGSEGGQRKRNQMTAQPVVDPALGRQEKMAKSLQVLQALSSPIEQDTLAFWDAAERWAHGEDSLRNEMESKQRYDRWKTLVTTTPAGLVRSGWLVQVDNALRAWGGWTGPTVTPLVPSRATPAKPAAPAPTTNDSSALSGTAIRVLMPDSSVVPVLLTKEQERLLVELNAQADRSQLRADATERFCVSLMPTGTAFATAAHKQLAIQSWGVLYSALPDGGQKKRVQAELERARSLEPKK